MYIAFAAIIHQYWNRLADVLKAITRDKPALFFSAFALYSLIPDFFGIQPVLAMLHSLGLLAVFWFIKLEYSLFSEKNVRLNATRLFFTSFLFVLITLVAIPLFPEALIFTQVDSHAPHGLVGLTGVPNVNAGILFTGLILTLVYSALPNIRHRLLQGLTILFSLALLIASNSRTSLYPAIALLFLYFLSVPMFLKNEKYSRYSFILLGLAILLILLFTVPSLKHYLFRWQSGGHDATSLLGLNGRQTIWLSTLHELFAHHNPWLGVGMGNQQFLLQAANLPFQKAHNTFIDVFLETGVIGFIFYLLAIVMSLYTLIKNFLIDKTKVNLIILLGTLVLLIHALAESYLNSQLNTHFYVYWVLYYFSWANTHSYLKTHATPSTK